MTEAPCCHGEPPKQSSPSDRKPDWLLRCSAFLIAVLYLHALLAPASRDFSHHYQMLSSSVFELVNVMWWGVLLGMLFVGLLSRVPREFVVGVLGAGKGVRGVVRATLAGVLLDLCSHGILMVGAQLYQRGASAGQVVAFLLASPWNSFSLTLILIALIGLPLTLLFIVASMLIAIVAGCLFDLLVTRGVLPKNTQASDLPSNFAFWPEAARQLHAAQFNRSWWEALARASFVESRMVLRWILFGIVLASLIRALMPHDAFASYFGASLAGLLLTIAAATVIEVCSEGSTPLAADLVNRAGAPGNGFAFLMAGVATDYTEVMVLKETSGSWRLALFLPLLTVPQIVGVAWLINMAGA